MRRKGEGVSERPPSCGVSTNASTHSLEFQRTAPGSLSNCFEGSDNVRGKSRSSRCSGSFYFAVGED